MKIIKSNILVALTLGAVIAFSGCRKDDGAIPDRVDISEVPAVTMPIDPTGSASIQFANQGAFAGKFRAELYFPGAKPPDKIDIMVRKTNGSVINNNNVRLYRADVTNLPASFTVTAAEIVALFGPIALNDNYDFGPDIYVGSNKYQAFPTVGTPTGAGVIGMPLFKEYARFRAL